MVQDFSHHPRNFAKPEGYVRNYAHNPTTSVRCRTYGPSSLSWVRKRGNENSDAVGYRLMEARSTICALTHGQAFRNMSPYLGNSIEK